VTWHKHIINFFSFCASRPITLIVFYSFCVFSLWSFLLSHNRFTLPAQTRSWYVSFNFSPTWFSLAFLIPYSKANLKSVAVKASPCLDHFEEETYERNIYLYWLYCGFNLTRLVLLTRFVIATNSMRIWYNISLLTESQAFLKSHYTPVSSAVSDERRYYCQQFSCNVRTHTDWPQSFFYIWTKSWEKYTGWNLLWSWHLYPTIITILQSVLSPFF
jgi:hypothetical protein